MRGQADGLTYSERTGFTAATIASTEALRRLFQMSALDIGGALRLDRPSEAPPLSVIATPYQRRIELAPRQPATLAFISGYENTDFSRGVVLTRLQSLFKLMPAEAMIALQIAQGAGLPVIAQTLKLSQSTVRTHAKHIFEKLGAHSQPQLVRVISNLCLIAGSP